MPPPPTPTVPPSTAILTIRASTRIRAPAALIFSLLLDTRTYPAWNTFVPRVDITWQPPGPNSGPSSDSDRQEGEVEDEDREEGEDVNGKDGEDAEEEGEKYILKPGTKMTFHAKMSQRKGSSKSTATNLLVTHISTPSTSPSPSSSSPSLSPPSSPSPSIYTVVWTQAPSPLSSILSTERTHEIHPLSAEECEVRTWECMSGVGAWAVKWMYGGVLEGKFGEWCGGLGGEGERLWREGVEKGREG